MKHKLSAHNRTQIIRNTCREKYDLVVIGGGITGAGIALDAATRGLKTLLLEKQDFAAGTSSRSTKLIHGGLRYLKQLEVSLVREVGLERAILYRNAPHIVIPRKMLLPIIQEGSLGKYSTSLGLYVYDRLAGVLREESRTMHNKEETTALEPLLRTDILLGSGLYYEYLTDDARLVIEVLKTAIKYGALALNYVEAVGFSYNNGEADGINVVDKKTNKAFHIQTQKIINATGPWVDGIRRKDESLNDKRLHLTKGVHIVVPYERLPLQQAVYFDVPDGRMMFAIPRGNTTYIGTTDTTYHHQLEHPTATHEDVTYILAGANHIFPSVKLQMKDVISSWSGLRPLIHQEGKSPSELSRKDEIFYSPSGIVSIAGGKLTGFRKMAERAVDVVIKELYKDNAWEIKSCITDTIYLGGGRFKHPKQVAKYIDKRAKQYESLGLSKQQVADLVYRYGKNLKKVIQILNKQSEEKIDLNISKRLVLAELHYTVRYEMVTNLSDFLIRRTARLYFERPAIESIIDLLLDELAMIFRWNERQKSACLQEFNTHYKAAIQFAQEVF